MSSVIFARPRHEYGSYQDIYELIRLSGYPLIYFDEIDPTAKDKTYILTIVNGENNAGWPGATARIILYDLEWRSVSDYPRLPGVAEVWAADAWYAKLVGAKYVPLGSHPLLGCDYPDSAVPKDGMRYDVAMLAYLSPRRQAVVGDFTRAGISLAPKGWGLDRAQTLWTTYYMLHVHQHDDISTVAPGRFALAAAFRMPLITETLSDPGIFAKIPLIQSPRAQLPTVIRAALSSYRIDQGEQLHDLLCQEYTFRRCIEGAL